MNAYNQIQTRRGFEAFTFFLIVFSLIILSSQVAADCTSPTYHAFGAVYSATSLLEGEEVPNNILSGIPEERILGENRIAQVERNMVKVSIVKESDGSLLGHYYVFNGGNYFISICAGSDSIEVRFIVEDLVSSTVIFQSEPTELHSYLSSYTPNIRYLLVLEEPT